ITSVVPLLQIGVMLLVHRGNIRPAVLLTFGILLVAASAAFVNSGIATDVSLVLVMPLIYATLIWSVPGSLAIGVYYVAFIVLTGILQYNGRLPNALIVPREQIFTRVSTNIVLLFFTGLLMSGIIGEFQRILRSIDRYSTQLRATGDIARLTAAT